MAMQKTRVFLLPRIHLGTSNSLLHFADGEKPETKQKRLETKYTALQIVPNIEKLGTPKVSLLITS
jgi:hypothetical protein